MYEIGQYSRDSRQHILKFRMGFTPYFQIVIQLISRKTFRHIYG